jgi:Protein of unknown function (DUF1214)
MYDGKTQLLVANPINRYLINSPMLPGMKENPDGSLTLYIQKDSPGTGTESNWLPAPDRPIYLVMRLYWPKDAVREVKIDEESKEAAWVRLSSAVELPLAESQQRRLKDVMEYQKERRTFLR